MVKRSVLLVPPKQEPPRLLAGFEVECKIACCADKAPIRAEAERMRMKASAYKQYGDAAILSLVLEALPQIAAEVS